MLDRADHENIFARTDSPRDRRDTKHARGLVSGLTQRIPPAEGRGLSGQSVRLGILRLGNFNRLTMRIRCSFGSGRRISPGVSSGSRSSGRGSAGAVAVFSGPPAGPRRASFAWQGQTFPRRRDQKRLASISERASRLRAAWTRRRTLSSRDSRSSSGAAPCSRPRRSRDRTCPEASDTNPRHAAPLWLLRAFTRWFAGTQTPINVRNRHVRAMNRPRVSKTRTVVLGRLSRSLPQIH